MIAPTLPLGGEKLAIVGGGLTTTVAGLVAIPSGGDDGDRVYMRKTHWCGGPIGTRCTTASASPRTSRVSTGSTMPSSQSRALQK
jgi:hypothetical protein